MINLYDGIVLIICVDFMSVSHFHFLKFRYWIEGRSIIDEWLFSKLFKE